MNWQGRREARSAPDKPACTYNFVPLSAFVHLPAWANQVSQDVPFKDGYCGDIEYTLTAETPILVAGNNGGSVKRFAVTPDEHGICRAAIHGSSVRGMLRNVLEITSFGKFQRVDDRTLSLRDITGGGALRGLYGERLTETVRPGVYRTRSRGGWLKFQDGRWQLTPCAIARVNHREIETALNITELRETIWDMKRNKPKQDRLGRIVKAPLSSQAAYQRWLGGKKTLVVKFSIEPRPGDSWPHTTNHLVYDRAKLDEQGPESGTLVFTGSVGPKRMEFIFYTPTGKTQATPIDVAEPVMAAFLQVHSEVQEGKGQDGTSAPNDTLRALRELFRQEPRGIPVFYLAEPDDATGEITAIGLSQMFRLAYERSIHEAIESINAAHLGTEPDLAELIFGRVPTAKQQNSTDRSHDRGLRGRVAFDTLVQQPGNDGQYAAALRCKPTVLGSPKPSFIPYYLHQPSAGTGNTLQAVRDNNGALHEPGSDKPRRVYAGLSVQRAASRKIAPADRDIPPSYPTGWKRYPVQSLKIDSNHDPVPAWQRTVEQEANLKDTVKVQVAPLPAGTSFKGRIRFHNLCEVELSALLWSLTWGSDNKYWHSLGMGRSFGWGGCRIQIDGIQARRNDDIDCNYKAVVLNGDSPIRDAFAKHMESAYQAWNTETSQTRCSWRDSEQIAELLAMADPTKEKSAPQELRHPKFILGRVNGFVNLKEAGIVLPRYGGHWAAPGSREATERTARDRVHRGSSPVRDEAPSSAGRFRSIPAETAPPDLDEIGEVAYTIQRVVESENVKAMFEDAGDVPAARWLRNALVTTLNDANENGANWHQALWQPALAVKVEGIRDKAKQQAVVKLILEGWKKTGLPGEKRDLSKGQMKARKTYERLKGSG